MCAVANAVRAYSYQLLTSPRGCLRFVICTPRPTLHVFIVLVLIPQGCGGWEHCLDTHASTGSAPLVWFGAWNQTLQPKLDRLLVTSREQQEGWSKDNGKQSAADW